MDKTKLVIGIFWLNFRIRLFCFKRHRKHGRDE